MPQLRLVALLLLLLLLLPAALAVTKPAQNLEQSSNNGEFEDLHDAEQLDSVALDLLSKADELMEAGRGAEALVALDQAIARAGANAADMVTEKAIVLLFGKAGVAMDIPKAVTLLTEAAGGGQPEAQALLAILMMLGQGVPVDDQLALVNLHFAAQGEARDAQLALGYRHRFGIGVPQSCESAANYYRLAGESVVEHIAETGVEPDYEAKMLTSDPVVPDGTAQTDDEVISFHRYAADQGSAHSQQVLGQLHWRGGHGVPVDLAAARRYFERAAAAGAGDAMASLGHIELEAAAAVAGGEPNYSTGIEWYRRAIERGSAAGMNGLGFAYLHGRGVSRDEAEARKWFLAAAEKGNAQAQVRGGMPCLYARWWTYS